MASSSPTPSPTATPDVTRIKIVAPDENKIVQSFVDMVNWFFEFIANLSVGLAVFAVFCILAVIVSAIVRCSVKRSHRVAKQDISKHAVYLWGALPKWAIIFIGFLFACVIAFPGIDMATMVATFGLSSIAVGFIFKDLIQNIFCGFAMLLSAPFKIDDIIVTPGGTGKVISVSLRCTTLLQLDNTILIVSNSTVYFGPLTLMTKNPIRRSNAVIGICYEEDIAEASFVLLRALRKVPNIIYYDPELKPVAVVASLNAYSIDIKVLWFTKNDDAIPSVCAFLPEAKKALDEAGISIAYPTRTIHQTPVPAQKPQFVWPEDYDESGLHTSDDVGMMQPRTSKARATANKVKEVGKQVSRSLSDASKRVKKAARLGRKKKSKKDVQSEDGDEAAAAISADDDVEDDDDGESAKPKATPVGGDVERDVEAGGTSTPSDDGKEGDKGDDESSSSSGSSSSEEDDGSISSTSSEGKGK
jgi:small-conductance mechanosensitive channel